MNNILQLKGRFETRSNPTHPGAAVLKKGRSVSAAHLKNLARQLVGIQKYWTEHPLLAGALVSVHYNQVVAKTNRIRTLLSENSKSPVESIRGAKFVWDIQSDGTRKQKHVFTHYIKLPAIARTISVLENAAHIIEVGFDGTIECKHTKAIADSSNFQYEDILKKTVFLNVVVDGFYVERFDIDRVTAAATEESIVTIYQTDIDTKSLLSELGINIVDDRIIDNTTLRLMPDEFSLLVEKAPYLIAMDLVDFSQLTRDDVALGEAEELDETTTLIPAPKNEPVIGVIDTHFDEKVYFHDWVDYRNMLDPDIPLLPKDYYHGTEVTSIIVDGPRGNPQLDDGCGHFRVRHFGVATSGRFSSFAILRLIRQIVISNRDIKVWNLSLGSQLEIKENSISPEAAELDRLQSEYDVIFVVAGTNIPQGETKKQMKIGAPADSLNSLVVNSVDMSGSPASYTRTGPVLSFFNKPDVSYYGGDGPAMEGKIAVCRDSLGAVYVAGTSFAAPWIARKMAYLIHVMGLSREIAKALLVDSAAKWNRMDDVSWKTGYGIVPKHIRDIVHSPDDEIRFVLSGTADEYETYTYNLPVPVVKNAHPFYARATLAYFPHCDRNQGVDYTSTEMDIHFGRIHTTAKGNTEIKSIDDNHQADEGLHIIYEEECRKLYRKWDNVKHISEKLRTRVVPRKAYETGLWGLSIKTKERMKPQPGRSLAFGVVVTLKEMNGVNRIDDFIKLCMARGWLVSKLDVENQVDIYLRAEEDLDLE